MSIKDYEKQFSILKNDCNSSIEHILNHTLEKIEFLESIYMSESNKHCKYCFSEEFRDNAVKERDELRKKLFACYNLLGY